MTDLPIVILRLIVRPQNPLWKRRWPQFLGRSLSILPKSSSTASTVAHFYGHTIVPVNTRVQRMTLDLHHLRNHQPAPRNHQLAPYLQILSFLARAVVSGVTLGGLMMVMMTMMSSTTVPPKRPKTSPRPQGGINKLRWDCPIERRAVSTSHQDNIPKCRGCAPNGLEFRHIW